jgi:hypothetical protein
MVSPEVAQCPSGKHTPGSVGHSESPAHARQTLVASQIGLVIVVQSVFETHATQAPEGEQTRAGPPSGWGQSMAAAQARQMLSVWSQTGFVGVLQSPLEMHSTHAPVDAHTGVPASVPPHSPVAHPRQVFVAVSQIGVVPAQELATHPAPPMPPLPPAPPSDETQPMTLKSQRMPVEQSESPSQKPGF